MTELIGLTILEQVTLLAPYLIYGGILFILLVVNTIITGIANRHKWKRQEEERLPEIVRRKLERRDKLIKHQQNEITKQAEIIERYSVATRAASMHSHKVSEILQMPLTNEVALRRRKRA